MSDYLFPVTIIILNRTMVHSLLFTQNKGQHKNKVIGLMPCNKVLNLRFYKKFKKVLFIGKDRITFERRACLSLLQEYK